MDGAGTGRVFTAPVVRDYGDLLAVTADSGLMHVGVSGPSAALVSAPAAPGDALGDSGQPGGGGESLPGGGGGGQTPGGGTAGAGGAGGGASGDGLPFTGFAAAAVGAAGAALASAGAAARRVLRGRG
jgi:hypothetical protein